MGLKSQESGCPKVVLWDKNPWDSWDLDKNHYDRQYHLMPIPDSPRNPPLSPNSVIAKKALKFVESKKYLKSDSTY